MKKHKSEVIQILSQKSVEVNNVKKDYKIGVISAQIYGKRNEVVTDDFLINVFGTTICVPKGFEYDGASVPRFFWWWLPPYGEYKTWACVHDWLYYSGLYDQKLCDDIFLILMRYGDTGKLRRFVIWIAVRLFGKKAYKAHRKKAVTRSQNKKEMIKEALIKRSKAKIEVHYSK